MLHNINRVAVLAAHPDDEAIGMGGTLLKLKNMGASIDILFFTDGVSARTVSGDDKQTRIQQLHDAMNFLSPRSFSNLKYPDNKMDSIPMLDVVKDIEIFLKDTRPEVLFTHFPNDLNIDHQVVFQAALTAARPGSDTFVKNFACFEVISSTDLKLDTSIFQPNFYFDISETIQDKMHYLKNYLSEMRPAPHPRSFENIQALAQLRGAHCSLQYAESFMLLRSVL